MKTKFIVIKAGPICDACAFKLKDAFDKKLVMGFQTGKELGLSMHPECLSGIEVKAQVEEIETEANCWNCGKKAVAWRKGFPICENPDCHHKAESEAS